MIYIKNNTEIQTIFIPRNELQKEAYIASTNAYDDGYRNGLKDGKEQQKDKLSNLNVTENGQYEREDGWNVVTVDVPDLNGSYNEGYEQGKTEGIDEQKSKLESINITENGVYSKEDGYNHIEVNVPSYEQGQADMAAKARVLNVTKNGTYLSKFSDPIIPANVTGVYANGTGFYSYAELTNKVFNTNIPATKDSRIEFWWKNDSGYKTYAAIIGGQTYEGYIFKFAEYSRNTYRIEYGDYKVGNLFYHNFDYDMTSRWNHIIFSKQDGLYVNDELICEVQGEVWAENETIPNFWINAAYLQEIDNNPNGTFGMIKINDVVIIPTANGFKNVNTGELLEVVRDGSYTFTENLPTYAEGELYKTINVNVPDLNGSYDEGKTDGINEQKSKLETINITENGTYNREDGYNKIIVKVPDLNGSYDDGYDQGQADIAENAIVLNVTENGVYKTKFSDPIIPTNYTVTGVYANGTEFYSYAQLTNKIFNTKIAGSIDSRLEFWYKGDNNNPYASDIIIGSGVNYNNSFAVQYKSFDETTLSIQVGNSIIEISNFDETVWHHFIISKAEGLWFDGEKKGDFSPTNTVNGEFFINCVASESTLEATANGYFGMIKIDDVVIIPTANGFKNVNTGELLEVVKDGDYIFTKNLPTYGEGEIYKTINVNVPQEAVSCNLEDKQVTPSMNDRDGNGFIVVSPSEGYDGLSRTVINPQTIYNEGVEAGKTEKETDIAENARVLEVTENGVYKSKYSDPIIPANYTVTGVYADGTNFYSYAELKGKVFNTNILATTNSRIEFWYKGDNTLSGDAYNVIMGAHYTGDSIVFEVIYNIYSNSEVSGRIGSTYVNTNWDENIWHHIILSKNDGFVVDGVKIGDMQSASYTSNGNFLINANDYNNQRNANGCFGMIKIDNTIIIPTANGFLNTNTGELLEVMRDGTYTYTENLPIYAEGELYKTINVNVPTVQEQITDYYYCPITITDSGFGERAKSFLVKNENMYGKNGWINDDSFVYLPTANNMNEVRTKTSPSLVASFPFDDNAAYYTGALYMNVEEVQMNNVVLSNLYKLELGSGCHTLRMESSNLPNINTLIIRYNGQQLFDYHFGLTQFKNGGKLYVYEGLGNAENLRAALGSEWTIEYL